jgi:hypothetical protein
VQSGQVIASHLITYCCVSQKKKNLLLSRGLAYRGSNLAESPGHSPASLARSPDSKFQ